MRVAPAGNTNSVRKHNVLPCNCTTRPVRMAAYASRESVGGFGSSVWWCTSKENAKHRPDRVPIQTGKKKLLRSGASYDHSTTIVAFQSVLGGDIMTHMRVLITISKIGKYTYFSVFLRRPESFVGNRNKTSCHRFPFHPSSVSIPSRDCSCSFQLDDSRGESIIEFSGVLRVHQLQ